MKLKYNLIAWSLLGFFAAACDPMDDIYNEIDAEGTTNTQTMAEYVLTDADYETISSAAAKAATSDAEKALANAVKTDKALNEFASAEKYVPSIIAKMLPSWGKGSSVGVTYNYQNTPSDYVLEYRTVTNTSLGDKDYEALWGEGSPVKFLAPAHAPATVLPGWLAGQYKDAAKGDLVLVDYKYDDVDPEFTGEDLYSQDFETVEKDKDIVLEGWEQVTLKGDKKWQGKIYSNNGYAQFSANNFEGEVDTWFISPAVAVTSKDAGLSFDIKFGYYNADCLDVLVSDTYAGNGSIDMAQWTSVKDQFTFPEGPANGYNDNFVNVGKAGLEAYNGKSVYVAFRYVGEGPKAKTTTVQLDNVSISSAVLAPTNEKPYNALYQFDGTDWKVKEDVSPPVSCIASVVMSQMNNPGKQKSVFMVDEFPTVNLQGIDVFIGTARKHNVATILAVQDFNQAIRDYGEKSANILRSSCGSQAYGMTGNEKTAKDLENLLGETKEAQESFSHQESGTGSMTESLQKEKVVKAREVAGQSVGHFIGKVAGGKPPYFNTQFNMCKFIDKDIPAFSKPVNLGDGKEELEYDIMEEIVSQHYLSIISKVNAILEDVKNKTETDNKNKEKNMPKDHNHKAWKE
jgi:hypothetical protein